ncbi:MAG: YgfZ/GcvT domain-containing protein [Caulobacteraceae bacterium]
MADLLLVPLASRALVRIAGPDWRGFLQGLLTQDVADLAEGDLRFSALLTPQGRLIFDLFLFGVAEGCLLDCAAPRREALIAKLSLHRLRARVEIEPTDLEVLALLDWPSPPPAGWRPDPRLPALGHRGLGAPAPNGARRGEEADYQARRLELGVPGEADYGIDRVFPIEADFDLLNGIDFKKGCFLGQETTSRMKRRGKIKSRMAPICFEGAPPPAESEILAGQLRAGIALSGIAGRAMALLRLDRLDGAALTLADGRACRAEIPPWMAAEARSAAAA